MEVGDVDVGLSSPRLYEDKIDEKDIAPAPHEEDPLLKWPEKGGKEAHEDWDFLAGRGKKGEKKRG